MRYRSRAKIIRQILEAANDPRGITRTQLMCKVFLSHDPLKEYVKVLTESDLLRYDYETRTFKTSQRGLRFLNLYDEIDQLMNEKEQQV